MNSTRRWRGATVALAAALALAGGGCAGHAATPLAGAPTPDFMASSPKAAAALPAGVLTAAAVPANRKGALCGSTLTACAATAVGHPSTTQPVAATVGNFTELDLQAFYNTPAGAEGSVAEGGPAPHYTPQGWGAAGINGTPYPAQYFPSTGNFTVQMHGLPVTFLVPAEGVGIRSTFDLGAAVDIPVPKGAYHGVWILGNGIGGGAGEVLLQAHYSDGTTANYSFNLTEWCSPNALAAGEFPAVLTPYLLGAKDGKMQPAYQGCGGLYAVAIPIDGARTLTGLSIPGSTTTLLAGGTGGAEKDFVTAISLQK